MSYFTEQQWRSVEIQSKIHLVRGIIGIGHLSIPLHHLAARPFPLLVRPDSHSTGLPYGWTGDSILLGHPRVHYERRPAECLLFPFLLFFLLSSLVIISFIFYSPSSCLCHRRRLKGIFPWQ